MFPSDPKTISYDFRTNFVRISYDFCTISVRISYDFRTIFVRFKIFGNTVNPTPFTFRLWFRETPWPAFGDLVLIVITSLAKLWEAREDGLPVVLQLRSA